MLFLAMPGASFAQETSGAGIGLKPATIEEGLEPGTTKQYTVAISNLSGQDQLYYLYKKDITGVKDGGVPLFADEAIEKTGFELSQWITLGSETIEIPKGQERTMSFVMSVPKDAAPGSHFGGIFVSAQAPKLRESGAAIGYEVANIISIRVAGEAVERAQIRQFSTDNYFYGKPEVTFNVRVQNEGNTLIRPTGPLEINNMFGKTVAKLIFNQEAAGVFPKNTREFTFSWTGEGPGFGRYEAIVNPSYGESGAKQSMSSTVTFWVLPMSIIGPALGVLLVLLLVTYFGVRIYVRQKLSYYSAAGGTRKLIRRRKDSSSSALFLVFTVMLSVTAVFLVVLVLLFA
jgi:hypothetical protein